MQAGHNNGGKNPRAYVIEKMRAREKSSTFVQPG
jgi:hypothetical protein